MAVLRVLRDPFANALRGRAANQAPVAFRAKKKKKKNPSSHPREAQLICHRSDPAEHRTWYCHGAPRAAPGRREKRMRRRRRRGCTNHGHPGRDVPPSSPSQNCRIKVSPGLSPGVVVRTSLRQSCHSPRANPRLPHKTCRDCSWGTAGKGRMLFSVRGTRVG